MKYIFHADDEHSDRWDFDYMIKELDPSFSVMGFADGLELMQHLTSAEDQILPSVIFLDLRMPVWDGVKTLRAIKTEPKFMAIPVYMWSATDSKNEMHLCMKMGAEDFIVKPMSEEGREDCKNLIAGILNRI